MKNSTLNKRKELFETIVQLFFIFLIIGFCFALMVPFLMPLLWAAILAVAFYPIFNYLQKILNGRKGLAATIITLALIALMLVPVVYFINAATSNIMELKSSFEAGTLKVAPPAEKIKDWPIIGKSAFEFLQALSVDLQQGLLKYEVQIKEVFSRVMSNVLSTGMAFLQFILSIIIAGVLLVSTGAKKAIVKFVRRIAGNEADDIVAMSVSTIHQVVKGILGVAVIQTIIQAFGFYMADIPYAGILILICLIFSILQIGPIIINIGVIAYLFSSADSGFATLWTVYFVISGLSDNVLKPLLLGKGAMVPMLVIFLGVIGGFILSGFIGLFVGPIVFSIGYKLFISWLDEGDVVADPEVEAPEPGAGL